LSLRAAVGMRLTPRPLASLSLLSSWSIVVLAARWRYLRLLLPPSLPMWMVTSDDAPSLLLGVASLLPWAGRTMTTS
jgi:hypothetical protein